VIRGSSWGRGRGRVSKQYRNPNISLARHLCDNIRVRYDERVLYEALRGDFYYVVLLHRLDSKFEIA
jgi:hypothetical protein